MYINSIGKKAVGSGATMSMTKRMLAIILVMPTHAASQRGNLGVARRAEATRRKPVAWRIVPFVNIAPMRLYNVLYV